MELSEKQIHILKIAEELIADKGYERTSVREICSKAEVNVAMISYYFGSKEKMMAYLYQYRVQKTRKNFSEFAATIQNGKPEMQMKEIIKYLVSQLFKYSYFHGFITQELQYTDYLKEELLGFYEFCIKTLDEVIKKGITTGVFTYAPKSEDILTNIIGSTIFVIRNKNFYEKFIHDKNEDNYLEKAEMKIKNSLLFNVFAILGYSAS